MEPSVINPMQEAEDTQHFDRLYTRINEHSVEVLASKGNIVITLRYEGEEDTQTVLEAVREFTTRNK